ncbi:MAG TPA: response regulator [Pirellulales bacterium]|nr:response regulator [Pirellulales bacterium]
MSASFQVPLCVYVVDDDIDTTDSMRSLFALWGHQVYVANDGARAIEQAPLIKPNLMVVDLAMPGVDGLELARRVRQHPSLAETSLVALTGYADPTYCHEALAAGFADWLVKPAPIAALESMLDRVRALTSASRERAAMSLEGAAASLQKAKGRQQVEEDGQGAVVSDAVPVRVEKSAISDILTLNDRPAAERLRQWLRERGCRVGPVFEPGPGRAAFFNYSRRQARLLLRENREFRIAE